MTVFNGKTQYKLSFSIAMFVYQRVVHTVRDFKVQNGQSSFDKIDTYICRPYGFPIENRASPIPKDRQKCAN
jgi:hypothetical protein